MYKNNVIVYISWQNYELCLAATKMTMMMMMTMIIIITIITTSTAAQTSACDALLCTSFFRSSLKILELTDIYLLNRSLREEDTHSPTTPFFLLSLSLSLSLSLLILPFSVFCVFVSLFFFLVVFLLNDFGHLMELGD